MVTVSDTSLREGIEQAIDSARKRFKPVLVSEVLEIDIKDPLTFFAHGKNTYAGERFFWKDPSETIIFAGLGICTQIQTEQASDRFLYVEEKWREIVTSSIKIGAYGIKGTGPLMFGGFSFDPLKKQTKLWQNYDHARFHLPEFLVTKTQGKTYLTTNVICTKNDDLSLAERIIAKRSRLLDTLPKEMELSPAKLVAEHEVGKEDWLKTVRSLVKDLENSEELKKVVMARELVVTAADDISVETVLDRLLREQPDSYTFAFEADGPCFIGASPERLAFKEGSTVYSACVAGSIARGKTKEEEKILGERLLADKKNLIEHQYVVDMIRVAMEKVCSELHIPDGPGLLKMRDIQHLYTPVTGKMNANGSLIKIVELLHPTPALGGFPKNLAVEKIRAIENLDRGFYGAPIGWIDEEGDGEFAVAIRSGLISGQNAHLFAGCGIVIDSDAESEFIETRIKFRPMLSALGGLKE